MLCRKPYMAGSIPFGCGQCLPCRINRRRQWMWRQFLESLCHDENCFVTLTYSDDCLPSSGELQPRDLQVFIREFRRACAPRRIRYFSVGEYGEQSDRPHYHLSVFGVSGFTFVNGECVSKIIERIWGKGFTSVFEFNHITAQYVAGYTTKKITDLKDGKSFAVPEFGRMSNRPGLGAGAMETLAKQLLSNYHDWGTGDVPAVLKIGERAIPLGRYLLANLRREVGFGEEYIRLIRQRSSWLKSVEMQSLLDDLHGNSTIKEKYLENIEGRLIQAEERAKRLNLKKRKL